MTEIGILKARQAAVVFLEAADKALEELRATRLPQQEEKLHPSRDEEALMCWELWDLRTANLVGWFDTEADAKNAFDSLIARDPFAKFEYGVCEGEKR